MSATERAALELYQPMQADVMIHRPPTKVLEEAKQAATALSDVISKKAKPVKFNGEQYLEFEDWQTVARFYGITAKVRETKFVQFDKVNGFEASAEAIMVSSGQVISAADAMCLNDEANWAKKPMFQLRSMAQTRACAKALRNVLSWVVVLAGYKPTPAEEMDGVFKQNTPPVAQDGPKCPKCGAAMNHKPAGTKKDGKPYPAFYSCSTYPNCKGTMKESEYKPVPVEPEPSGDGSDPVWIGPEVDSGPVPF